MKASMVFFGSARIDYQINYAERKSLGITVTPEMKVIVKAPIGTAQSRIDVSVQKKAPWILKQIEFFQSFQPKISIRKYVSGETHLYLGRQYQLKVNIDSIETVKLQGRYIHVYVSHKSHVQDVLNQWYLNHAKAKFHALSEPLVERFSKYNVSPTSIVIRKMTSRWGSCTAKGKIILNPELIKAPKPCIEYVIIHELCHLVHHDHTQKFYELQTREMKDWQKWKDKLEKLLA